MSGARFIFLGTGTSGGIPIIACDCAVCRSTDPRDTRTRTGAAIHWTDPSGQERLAMLDCTPDIRMQALRHDLRRCDAIFFTHQHVDHIFGLDEVRRFNAVMQRPIDIYAEPRCMGALRRVYQHIFDRDSNTNDSFVASLIPHTVDCPGAEDAQLPLNRAGRKEGGAGAPVLLHGLRFVPIRVLHGRMPILGWRIEDAGGVWRGNPDESIFPLAYCTDTSAIPPGTWSELEGLSVLVLDALRIRKHPTHFSLNQAVSAAQRIGARQTFFIHIAHEMGHAEIDAQLPPGMNLAYDGLVLDGGERGRSDEAAQAPGSTKAAPDRGGGSIFDDEPEPARDEYRG